MIRLRSREAYWAQEEPLPPLIPFLVNSDAETLSREQLLLLVKELDRRFIQLWDKVQYENANHRP